LFSKNKKIMMVLAIVVVGALFGGTLATGEWIFSQEDAKDLENEKVANESHASFYELAYAKATSEQKEELDRIIADKSIGWGEWRRPVLIAIGELPKDQPRLSAKQAAELYDSKEIRALEGEDKNRALEAEFNKIAGAPDFFGGSGIERAIYYLNEDRSEAIFLFFPGDVSHVVFNDDGTQTRLPLGNQKLPMDPGPSNEPLYSQNLPSDPSQ
jgi:hypothetical protein